VARVFPVIATRNRPEALREQVRRLAAQLCEGERIVVVHDAEDRPALDAHEGRAQHIVLAAHMGVDRARRLGNALVPADAVVCEIDDHDFAEPGLLAALREAFADPAVLYAYCDVWYVEAQGGERNLREKGEPPAASKGNLGWGLRAYRKWAYDCVGGYPLDWFPVNDVALLCMLDQFGGDACGAHIRRPLVTVRTGGGLSAAHAARQERELARVANRARKRGFDLPFAAEPVSRQRPQAEAQPPARARAHTIPRVVHFVWVGPEMPDYARYNIARFQALNPAYLFLTHGEDMLLPGFRSAYERIAGAHACARKSDLIRVTALVRFGGWYFDCDFLPLRPIDEIYRDEAGVPEGAYLTRASHGIVANGVIGAGVNAPFLRVLHDAVHELARTPRNRGWGAYGPQLYTRLAREHPDLVRVGAADQFYPLGEGRAPREAWLRLRAADCAPEAVRAEFGTRVPYMMHMAMRDGLDPSAPPAAPGTD